jgi:hypothetical protein
MNQDRLPASTTEIGVWASLLSTLGIYGVYCATVAGGAVTGGEQVALLIGLVVLQVVVLIGFHIGLAIWRGAERPDERDAAISLHGERLGYAVLSFGVATLTILYLLWGAAADASSPATGTLRVPSVAMVGHGVLLCFVAAELAKGMTQIVLYRRGGA